LFGRHFIIGLRPTIDLHPDDRRLLATLRPAGAIVYRGNFEQGVPYARWHARFASLVAAIKDAIGRDKILIAIDHEGGTVLRPPAPVTPFAFARQWAGQAEAVGAAMGVELASLGINLNFAPVADIDSNPRNPVIGPRAFGTTPDEVIAATAGFVAGMERESVLACPKHFPGHGDTLTDSHVGLPSLDVDRHTLATRELRPFAALVRQGVRIVMTAHISFPQIDPAVPATMSRAVVDGMLRDELGFRNVVVTDDIGMHAVSTMFEAPGACARVLASGTDMIMVCSHWTSTDRAYGLNDDLQRSVATGELAPEIIDASGARIEELLAAAPSNEPRMLPPEVFALHAASAPIRARPGAQGQTVSLEEA
jgi:beta-N-acetylhexosaminidase